MIKTPDIVTVKFRPPNEERLAVEVLSIDDLKSRASVEHFATLQRADFYRLFGVLEGTTKPMVDFSHHSAQAQDWLLIRPGQVMRYDFSQHWAGWLVVFRPDSLFSATRSTDTDELSLVRRMAELVSLSSLNPTQHQWIERSVRQMQLDGSMPISVALRNEILRLQLASTLLRLSAWQTLESAAPPTDSRALAHFKRFRQKLEADFAQQHQVQHYAAALGMSEKNLSRVCHAGTGMSAKACIAARLTLEAKRNLAHTTLAVQIIANQLGFDEATNFVKFFRKETGQTPKAFRIEQSKPR